MSENLEPNLGNLTSLITDQTPHLVAFVIDNEVVFIIGATEMYYSILMSNPTIKDVSGQTVDQGGTVTFGSIYNPETETFELPQN
jgi:hypothetical protein